MALAAGTAVGPYEIVGLIGVGGMGEVYRAKDARLQRTVAIKVLPASFSTEPTRLRRFEHEARAAGSLNHPNIVAVYDVGAHDASPYIVTEFLEGQTLRDKLVSQLSVERATDYATQIASGPRGRARQRHPAPRPQAGKRLRDEGRSSEDPRLRSGKVNGLKRR